MIGNNRNAGGGGGGGNGGDDDYDGDGKTMMRVLVRGGNDHDHRWMGPLYVTGRLSISFLKYFYNIPGKHYSMELSN
jgi:hypothetical protein